VHRAGGPTDPTSSLDSRPADGCSFEARRPSGRREDITSPMPRYLIASRDVLGSRCGRLGRSRERLEFIEGA
jgi:hypothetical protein